MLKIIHTADLHLGQVMYNNYGREDEHSFFFDQLGDICLRENPDALVISGDVFDIQQPSAATRRAFSEEIARLRGCLPHMRVIITAGNHDSPSRIESDSAMWGLSGAHLIGTPPPLGTESVDSRISRHVIRLENGYIVALPFMNGDRSVTVQQILDHVSAENKSGKPVVMTGHTAVADSDTEGHDICVGRVQLQSVDSLGRGYDYLALGHIHKPQTIGHHEDMGKREVRYAAPVVRYSGSPLHVSCDECYPHSISIVEIDRHGGEVTIREERIRQLRHFKVLPPADTDSFSSAEEALSALEQLAATVNGSTADDRGVYFRFRMKEAAELPADFNQRVYDIIERTGGELRFNPKIIWTDRRQRGDEQEEKTRFEVAELAQMTNPLDFIATTIDSYPEFSLDELREAFKEIEAELRK